MINQAKQQRKAKAKARQEARRALINSGVKPPKKVSGYTVTYADRNRLLKKMGYASYTHYLKSELWAKVKKKAWARHGHKCQLCNKKAEVLHHKGYGRAVLNGTDVKPLVPLCHDCHHRVEFTSKNIKRTLAQANTAFTRLLKAYRGDTSKNGSKAEAIDVDWAKKRNKCPVCNSMLRKNGNRHCRTCARVRADKDTMSYLDKSKPKPITRPPCVVCGKPSHGRYLAPKINTLDHKERPRSACRRCMKLLTFICRSEEFNAQTFQSHSIMTFSIVKTAREQTKRRQ